MDSGIVYKYFPDLTDRQKQQFALLGSLYPEWNEKINVISRADIDQLYTRHILHSLAIAKFNLIDHSQNILDVGTGGGFPGIPLAIMYPEKRFTLIDSIGKKITVVQDVIEKTGLTNTTAIKLNSNDLKIKFDTIDEEIAPFRKHITLFNIPDVFEEEFFETKKVIRYVA